MKILRKYLDTIKKRSKDFQYLWVDEKQTKNEVFKDNIHFHLITNKYWDVKKDWKFWIDTQKKSGIVPREENFNPSSALDVRGIVTNNIKGITCYLTKYVSKNASALRCQLWNCSKKISALSTSFYSDSSFIEKADDLVGNKVKNISLEYCNLHLIPLSQKTMYLYDGLRQKNKSVWLDSE